MKKTVPLVLSPSDARILEAFQADLAASASDVLRWALRFYALRGPLSPGRKRGLIIGATPTQVMQPTPEPEEEPVS